jgi:hypothetical protein
MFSIRCGRTLAGFPFNPLLKENDYLEMEKKVKEALESVKEKDLKGIYYPLEGMSKKTQNQLIQGLQCSYGNIGCNQLVFRSLFVQGRRSLSSTRKRMSLLAQGFLNKMIT